MRVLNKKTDRIPEGAIYIGRPSVFGNPFRIGEGKAVRRPMTRAEVIDRYRHYFNMRLKTDPDFKAAVEALAGKDLVCFCAPKSCHGDVIVDYLKSRKMP